MRSMMVLLGFLLVCFAAAAIGGWVTAPAVRDWYPALVKPSWTPPAWLFGPAWTILYLCMALAGFLAWRKVGFAGAKWTMALFAAQLVLNAAWSLIFFGLRQPGWAFGEVIALWAAIAATMAGLFRVAAWPGLLFVPYLLWVTFASALNYAIWRLNPTL